MRPNRLSVLGILIALLVGFLQPVAAPPPPPNPINRSKRAHSVCHSRDAHCLAVHATVCDVYNTTVTDVCRYVQDDKYCREDVYRIDYLALFYCNNKALMVVVFLAWMFFLFYVMTVTAEMFLCPAIEFLVAWLRMSPDIAGVTLFAFASGAPDLFTQIAALAQGDHVDLELAVSATFGGGLFIICVVLSTVILVNKGGDIQIPDNRSYLRDVSAYLVASIIMLGLLWYGKLGVGTGIFLFLGYFGYLGLCFATRSHNANESSLSPRGGPHSSSSGAYIHVHSPSITNKHHHFQGLNPFEVDRNGQGFGVSDGELELVPLTSPDANSNSESLQRSSSNPQSISNTSNTTIDSNFIEVAARSSARGGLAGPTALGRRPSSGLPGSPPRNSLIPPNFESYTTNTGNITVNNNQEGLSLVNSTSLPTSSSSPAVSPSSLIALAAVEDGFSHQSMSGVTVASPTGGGGGSRGFGNISSKSGVILGGNGGGSSKKRSSFSVYGSTVASPRQHRSTGGGGGGGGLMDGMNGSGSEVWRSWVRSLPTALEEALHLHGKTGLQRGLSLVLSPVVLFMHGTMPAMFAGTFSMMYGSAVAVIAPLFFLFATPLGSGEVLSGGGVFMVWLVSAICIFLLVLTVVKPVVGGTSGQDTTSSLTSFFLSKESFHKTMMLQQRPRQNIFFALLAFLQCILWLNTTANEVVALFEAIGRVWNVRQDVLGATILAWGETIPDLVAVLSLAKTGQATMVIAACFGGPVFNLLVSMGGPILIAAAKNGALPYHLTSGVVILIATTCLILAFFLILPPLKLQWKLTRWVGIGVLGVYGVSQFVFLAAEGHVLRRIKGAALSGGSGP